ncbi:MAG: hydrolase [Oscillospiraceae bacterium]|jgi:uncharacterized protein|nr:hydrolase [Oscillospiraceae bacterium]
MKTCKTEFYEHIQGLLDHETVKLLDNFTQHFKYTRLRHSLDVAYYSFFISRLFCLDSRSAARAGLLHDLFFHEEGQHSGSLLISHPRIALENARQICSLNKVEENIILRHMWLLTPCPQKYVEGFVVTFVDKYCAAKEFIVSTFMKKHRMRTAFSVGV